jgi:hypothetical protein
MKLVDMVEGAFLAFLFLFVFLAIKNGGAWALTKVKTWWNTAKVDLVALDARVTSLEKRVATPAPVVAPAPAPAPAPVPAPAPALA